MNSNRFNFIRPVPYAYLLPFFIAYLLFWLIPIGEGLYLSLQSNTLFGQSNFVGLKHYINLPEDSRFFLALYNTSVYSILTIAIILPFSLLLAHLLVKSYTRMRGFISFCLLLPGLTPPLALALLFLLLFIGRYGILNNIILYPLGFPRIDWMRDPDFIMPALIIQAVWRWSGFITFFLLSGLEGIPKSYYDIARAEGADGFQIFWRITLPLLRNILIFAAIVLFLDAFVLFEGAYLLLNSSGGPGDAALLLVGYTYQTAFSNGNFETAAAMSFSVIPLLLFVLWLLLLRMLKK